MAEWLKAPVLKTGMEKSIVGSNPSPSARITHYVHPGHPQGVFYSNPIPLATHGDRLLSARTHPSRPSWAPAGGVYPARGLCRIPSHSLRTGTGCSPPEPTHHVHPGHPQGVCIPHGDYVRIPSHSLRSGTGSSPPEHNKKAGGFFHQHYRNRIAPYCKTIDSLNNRSRIGLLRLFQIVDLL